MIAPIHPAPLSRRPFTRTLLVAAMVLAGWVALVTTSLNGWNAPAIGEKQGDYYNSLIRGLLHGHLYLDIPVAPAVLAVVDPLDPHQNPPGNHPPDVSYARGHYYIYFGIVPVAILMLPFRILTGHELPLVYASLAFALGAVLVTSWLWNRLLDDNFPQNGWITRLLGLAVIALCGGQWALARRVSIWEPSIGAGYFFMLCSVATGYLALTGRRPRGWLTLCGLAFALAVGCRPILVIAGGGVVMVAWLTFRRGRSGPHPLTWRNVAVSSLPLAVVATGLAAYNVARFGNPTEFGLHYQLTGNYEAHEIHFSLRYFRYDLCHYFLLPPQWGPYFPFLHPPEVVTPPARHVGYEYLYGVLVICPVLWWLVGLPLVRQAPERLRGFLLTVAAVGLPMTGILLCFNTAAVRYQADFLPWWVWCATIAWALVEHRLAASPRGWLGLARTAFVVTALASLGLAFCASAEVHEIFSATNPAGYRAVTRVLDAPTDAWERVKGLPGGPVRMRIAFPKKPSGSYEPIIVTGVSYQRCYLYAFYQGGATLRLVVAQPGRPQLTSEKMTVVPGRDYTLEASLGSLYPPAGDGAFRGWPQAQVESVKEWVEVRLDGKTVLAGKLRMDEASPGSLQIGHDAHNFAGDRFTGEISVVERLAYPIPASSVDPAGGWSFDVPLPAVSLAVSPLMEYGRPGRAFIVGLTRTGPDHFQFVFERWGFGQWKSAEQPMPKSGRLAFQLNIALASPSPRSATAAAAPGSATFLLGGKPVWEQLIPETLPADSPVFFFENAVGSSAVLSRYEGARLTVGASP